MEVEVKTAELPEADGDGQVVDVVKPAEQRGGSVVEALWGKISAPLVNFGFGNKAVTEGSYGLFVVAGLGLAAFLVSWVSSISLRTTKRYQAIVEFPQACGISTGTPVRVRGVQVGSVLKVQPSLERVDVTCEINDDNVVIPRNSLVEANQSGLISEPLIDITPRLPIPTSEFKPHDGGCDEEGAIVCHRGRIVGERGVSLDELVKVCTKLAQEMDRRGIGTAFDAMESADRLVADLHPLVAQVKSITDKLDPLLTEVSDGNMLASIDTLAASAAATAEDIRRLNRSILTDENTELLREAVVTLTKTLQHVEGISGNVSSVTGDPVTHQNIRTLITALSRVVDE